MNRARIDIPDEKIAEFCRRNRIRQLALFGSVLRDDFRPDSDVDGILGQDRSPGAAFPEKGKGCEGGSQP